MRQSPTHPPHSPSDSAGRRRSPSLLRRTGLFVATGALIAGGFAIAAPAGATTGGSARAVANTAASAAQSATSSTSQRDRQARKTRPTPTKPTPTTPAPTTPTPTPTTPAPTTPPAAAAAWTAAGSMGTPRIRHASAGLLNGQVLVTGGMTSTAVLRSSELYNPATKTWRSVADAPVAVYDAAAVTLPDGTVLVAGGSANIAQLYHPATNTWTRGATLAATGDGQAFAATLPNGTVFVLDGSAANAYNPVTGRWTALAKAPAMRTADHFTARDTAQLPNGDIVTARAIQYVGSMPGTATTGPAVYHWSSNTWTMLPKAPQNPGDARVSVAALPNGNVMVAGGILSNLWFPSTVTTVMEVNPATGTWTIDSNSAGTDTVRGQLVTLPNGTILSTGGNWSADMDYVYNPRSGSWTAVPGRNADNTAFATLANGSIMATGGYSDFSYPRTFSAILGTAAIFTP